MSHDLHNIEQRIENHGIRPTPVRGLVLGVLDDSVRPLSSLEIEQALDTVDRSSITRTLSLFVEKGLVHIIDDGTSSAKYEACPSPHHHTCNDMHVHFHCRVCGRTYCLSGTPPPPVSVPYGFLPESTNYLLTGLCPDCR